VRIIEELLEWNSIGSGQENRINGRGDPLCWPRDTLYPQKLALTSPKIGGRSVGIVRLRTKWPRSLVPIYIYCNNGTSFLLKSVKYSCSWNMQTDRQTVLAISNCSSWKEWVINLCSGVLLEKLRVPPPFVEPQGSLLRSVQPATGPYHALLESLSL
jgi:hypothetical protein